MLEIVKEDTIGNQLVGTKTRREILMQRYTDVDSLPDKAFTSEKMAPYLTPRIINRRDEETSISQADLPKIKANIQRQINRAHTDKQSNDTQKAAKGDAYIKQWEKWTNKDILGAKFGLQTQTPTNQANPSNFTSTANGQQAQQNFLDFWNNRPNQTP